MVSFIVHITAFYEVLYSIYTHLSRCKTCYPVENFSIVAWWKIFPRQTQSLRGYTRSCWLHGIMKGTLHLLSLLQMHVATVGLFTPSFWQPVCLDFLHQALRLVLIHLWYKQHGAILLAIWTFLNSQVTGMTNQMMVNVIRVFASKGVCQKVIRSLETDDMRNLM